MFKFDRTIEKQLFAYTPRDMVPEDSDAWLYIDLFDSVNLDSFYSRYSSQGQDSVDCRLMLRTIFYGLTHGICSGRKLAAACQYDNRYMVLSGGYAPNFRTFHRFFCRHERDIESLFVQIVKLAKEMKLVSLGRIAIDGSRIKANASRKGMIRYNKLDNATNAIQLQIRTLKEELASENHERKNNIDVLEKEISTRERRLERIKAAKERIDREYKAGDRKSQTRVSLNDTDARFMGKEGGNGNYSISYNCQASVDSDNQIIVAAEIHDSPQDASALIKMIEKTTENCSEAPRQVFADRGYCTSDNIVQAKSRCEELFVSMTNLKGEVAPIKSEYVFRGANDQYVCMAGKVLRIGKNNTKPHTVSVLPDPNRCDGCQFASACPLYPRRAKYSAILDIDHGQVLAEMAHRNRTPEFQEAYKYRKAIVEPVFGNIKWNKAIKLFVTRKQKASAWWKMVCTAHNIEKIIGHVICKRSTDGDGYSSSRTSKKSKFEENLEVILKLVTKIIYQQECGGFA